MTPRFSRPDPSSPLGRSSSSDGNNVANAGSDIQDEAGRGKAFYKRKYLEMKAELEESKNAKKKKTSSLVKLGRGIRRLVVLTGGLKTLILDADKHLEYVEDPDSDAFATEFEGLDEEEAEDLKRDWERCNKAVKELFRLLPSIRKTIDATLPEDLKTFYDQLEFGAGNARSDDLQRIRKCLATWLNKSLPTPSPLLDEDDRANRGLNHDLTGRLLCPIEFDWDDLNVRAKLRANEEGFDWLSSLHSRAFYHKFKGDPERLEDGFLKSSLLVKVFKSIFTSPSSAADVADDDDSDIENEPPTKKHKKAKRSSRKKGPERTVASILEMKDKVTPRSVAYAAVQLHFNLQTAERWSEVYGGFDYCALYNYVVDFFEDVHELETKKRSQKLLEWWNGQVFPEAVARRESNTTASRSAMKRQRAARSSATQSTARSSATQSTVRSSATQSTTRSSEPT